MRIVMLSCNTGEGHNSTAKAIQDVLKARGVECEIVDVLACLSPGFSKFVCNWHARLYKYAPKLWDVSYRAFEMKELRSDESAMMAELLSFGKKKLKAILNAGQYDAIVCVHVFSGMMMTELRESYGISTPCFFVATDYTCYPYVDCCKMDGYFIPSPALVGEFEDVGIAKRALIPWGIPVRQEFYIRSDKTLSRLRLQLPETGQIVLLMCGSMGCGPMKKLARELTERLSSDATLVAFCGKNKSLYTSLSEIDAPNLRVLGYTDQVGTYMDAADVIVTKPGGLSATEAANKKLPMVLINAIGGCESRNFDFFLNRGYALGSKRANKVLELTVMLANDPAQRDRIRSALEKDFSSNSALAIADTLIVAILKRRGTAGSIKHEDPGHPLSKGGCAMETTKQETLLNLARSFAGESQARTRYTIYAQVARKEGYEWIARVFEETAANEAVHAEEFLEKLVELGGSKENIDLAAGYPFQLGTTAENLAFAAEGELHEHDHAYPDFAEMARREGCDDAARLWLQIARIEGVHHNAFRSLKEQLESGTLTEKADPVLWRCLNCGYTYEGIRACNPCPVCGKDVGWQEGQLDKRNLIQKKS